MQNAFSGINLAKVYKDVENIETSKQNREYKNTLMKNNQEDRTAASEKRNKLRLLKGAVATGGEEAMTALTLFDAQEAKAIQGVFESRDKKKIDLMKQNIEGMGRIAMNIKSSKVPAEQYIKSREYLLSLDPKLAEQMPEEYDPNFVEFMGARATQVDEYMNNPTSVQEGDGKVGVYQMGNRIGGGKSNALMPAEEKTKQAQIKADSKGKGKTGLKSSDVSEMRRQAGDLLGAMFDKDGNIRVLDPTLRAKAQRIITRAEELLISGEARGHAQAVSMAAKENGEDVGSGKPVTRRKFNPTTGKFE